jgi:hypothetical protein
LPAERGAAAAVRRREKKRQPQRRKDAKDDAKLREENLFLREEKRAREVSLLFLPLRSLSPLLMRHFGRGVTLLKKSGCSSLFKIILFYSSLRSSFAGFAPLRLPFSQQTEPIAARGREAPRQISVHTGFRARVAKTA